MKMRRSKINRKFNKKLLKLNQRFVSSLFQLSKIVEKNYRNIQSRFRTALFYFSQELLPSLIGKAIVFTKKLREKIYNILQTTAGNFYDRYVFIKERFRISLFNAEKEKNKHGIAWEILKYSRYIVIYLLFFFTLSSILDWLFWNYYSAIKTQGTHLQNFTLPSKDSLEIGIEIFVGAISAILGLIFALYTVGVQLSNNRYSEKVSDFINQESVSDYFFSFLIFTDIYALLILLKLYFYNQLPIVSFVFSTVFVALSLLGILIFKNHYVNSLKPLNLFQSIWTKCRDQFETATSTNSFRYNSWSLIIHSRNSMNRYLDILGDLFRDLVRNKKWNDSSYAPVILGNILRDYLESKKFIDKERGWWFFEKYEQVKADDLNMYSIKANYELQGRGSLHIPKAAENWVEDKVISLFEEMSLSMTDDNSNKIMNRISNGYKQFLVGDYKEQSGEPPVLIPGAIHLQEFDVFERGLKGFISYGKSIDFSKTDVVINFFNDYFAISEGLMDKWNIEKALDTAKTFYIGDQLNEDRKFFFDKTVPTFTRDILQNYWERLQVEQELEGKIITPLDRFIEEIKDVLDTKRKEIVISYLTLFFDDTDRLMKDLLSQGRFEDMGQFIKMRYEWISRLSHLGDFEIADHFSDRIRTNAVFIYRLPKDIIEKLELLEQIERGFFVSLSKRQKSLYKVYTAAMVLVLIIIRSGETNTDKLYRFIRMPVIWGGIAYLISEADQDFEYITSLTKALEQSFRSGWMVEILENAVELNVTKNIWWESTRYSGWYINTLNELRRRFNLVPDPDSQGMSFRRIYDHPSSFIRSLAEWDLIAEERSMEAYIDWLKKREIVSKLVKVLSEIEKLK
jgi:hypothetical protein